MKSSICKLLLSVLNSRWLNGTPSSYEFIDSVNYFRREYLMDHKDWTISEFLSDEGWESATMWDVHSLRQQLRDDR